MALLFLIFNTNVSRNSTLDSDQNFLHSSLFLELYELVQSSEMITSVQIIDGGIGLGFAFLPGLNLDEVNYLDELDTLYIGEVISKAMDLATELLERYDLTEPLHITTN